MKWNIDTTGDRVTTLKRNRNNHLPRMAKNPIVKLQLEEAPGRT